MKITQEDIMECQTVLQIELEEKDLEPYLQRGYQKLVQQVVIPGFRKGKAPRSIVEQFIGRESLLQEVLEDAVPALTNQAVSIQELEPAVAPRVEVVDLEPVRIKATVALEPNIDIGAYKDIRVEETVVEVTEEQIEERLQDMRARSASWEPAERPVRTGDMVTIDIVGTVDGKAVLKENDAVYVADDGSTVPFPHFSENLVDATKGTPKEFTITISEEYADVNLAGKDCHFTVTVSEVKQQELPELDDEFAKGAGDGYETLTELRESVENELREAGEQEQKAQYRQQAVEALAETAAVGMPPLLVQHEVEHAIHNRNNLVGRLNMRLDDYLRYTGKTEEEDEKEMREASERRLTQSYVIRELAEREGITVGDEEVDERIQEVLSSGDEAAKHIRENPDDEQVRTSIRDSLLVDKSVDLLTTIANGTHFESSIPEMDNSGPEPEEPKTN